MLIAPGKNLKVLVLHGPNLNLLGFRQPEIYGSETFESINKQIEEYGKKINVEVRIQQSNHEGVLIDAIHEAIDWADGIVINPGAYTHYSYAIADAIRAVRLPVVEVHLSNVHGRDDWRRRSVVAEAVVGQIAGFGGTSYLLGLDALRATIEQGRQ
jgi:3-dehydroquinate dehydratase II